MTKQKMLFMVPLLFSLAACESKKPVVAFNDPGGPIKIIIPDSYSNNTELFIELDGVNGKLPEQQNGHLVYEFSESGVKYKSFAPFRIYRKQEVVTKSGKPLGSPGGGELIPGMRMNESNESGPAKENPDGSLSASGDADGARIILRISLQ